MGEVDLFQVCSQWVISMDRTCIWLIPVAITYGLCPLLIYVRRFPQVQTDFVLMLPQYLTFFKHIYELRLYWSSCHETRQALKSTCDTLILIVVSEITAKCKSYSDTQMHTTSTCYERNHRWTSGPATCVAIHTAPIK